MKKARGRTGLLGTGAGCKDLIVPQNASKGLLPQSKIYSVNFDSSKNGTLQGTIQIRWPGVAFASDWADS